MKTIEQKANEHASEYAHDTTLVRHIFLVGAISRDEEVGELKARIKKLEAVVHVARTLVAMCKGRNIDVEWKMEGGLMGQPMKELSKVSVLDALHQLL